MEWVELTTKGHAFESPVWIDLLTGRVYEFGNSLWSLDHHDTVFSRLPVYDSVVVIAEKKEVERLVQLAKPLVSDGALRGPTLEMHGKTSNPPRQR